MTRKLFIALAIVTLSASAASAAYHHHHALNANAAAPDPAAPPSIGWTGGPNSTDHATYLRNLHDSGYNPKNDRDANGNEAAQ
ncbi:hypothetical protein G8O24_26350 [Bradyrhizobium sp. INPA01-394B]|uniref:DUF4148 domain-containing protein n=1 Tax=Bradyrhizobium campsiandrae TaxID=1729892 RepID=A0ABR7UDU3_9BRAD|nr:hypothetical protein [Bradyrhizobium campsiandrae]MBC9880852.1 hypothetical protein [Bradyrhizobium campsiandrae]MBC9981786.1 hypothetical protein [Bradyrhizobium campsiandrae]